MQILRRYFAEGCHFFPVATLWIDSHITFCRGIISYPCQYAIFHSCWHLLNVNAIGYAPYLCFTSCTAQMKTHIRCIAQIRRVGNQHHVACHCQLAGYVQYYVIQIYIGGLWTRNELQFHFLVTRRYWLCEHCQGVNLCFGIEVGHVDRFHRAGSTIIAVFNFYLGSFSCRTC